MISPVANGDLGIAMGDVSGKGIAAALLMASLQAFLRGQAMMNQGDLARLMRNINQLIYETTGINRYATFFYGQFNLGKPHFHVCQRRAQRADHSAQNKPGRCTRNSTRNGRTRRGPAAECTVSAGHGDLGARRCFRRLHGRRQRSHERQGGRMGRGASDSSYREKCRPARPWKSFRRL